MSGQHSKKQHDLAAKHAPILAEKMTKLCGQVIAKGLTGILEEVFRIHSEHDEMLGLLKKCDDLLCGPAPWTQEQVDSLHEQLRAAISRATGVQS